MKKQININGVKVKVWTEKFFSPRFGYLWGGRNDYGEPKTTDLAFSSEKEAMENELMELRKMLNE